MTDSITQWFNTLGAIFASLLAHTEFGALVVGTLAAIAITQVVKMLVISVDWMPNGTRGLWYVITTTVGLIVTVLNWPTLLGFSWGLCVGGLFAPALYLIGTRTLYKFWPDLKSRISATPRQ